MNIGENINLKSMNIAEKNLIRKMFEYQWTKWIKNVQILVKKWIKNDLKILVLALVFLKNSLNIGEKIK